MVKGNFSLRSNPLSEVPRMLPRKCTKRQREEKIEELPRTGQDGETQNRAGISPKLKSKTSSAGPGRGEMPFKLGFGVSNCGHGAE